MKKIYFAAPLFAESEQAYNKLIVDEIREIFPEQVEIYLPQENADINDKSGYASSVDILEADLAHVDSSDIMIAILDGNEIDPGVAAEIGYAFSEGKTLIGLLTDIRQQGWDNDKKLEALGSVGENQFIYRNLFVTGMINKNGYIATTRKELYDYLSFCL